MGEAVKAISLALALVAAPATLAGPSEPADVRLERAAIAPAFPHEVVLPPNLPYPGKVEGGFRVEIDPLTGRPQRAVGGRIPWIPGAGNDLPGPPLAGTARRGALYERAEGFVRTHAELYRLPAAALVRDEAGSINVEEHELDVVRLALVASDGTRVLGGGLVFGVRYGDLVYFGSSWAVPPTPEDGALRPPRGADEALARALEHAGVGRAEVEPQPVRRERFLLPARNGGGVGHRPIRAVRLHLVEDQRDWEAWIDEQDGSVVSLFRAEVEGCASAPVGAPAKVHGGVRLARADDAEVVRPLPHVDLGSGGYGDRHGAFLYDGATPRSTLSGRYATINCIACRDPLQAVATGGDDGSVDFGTNPPGDEDAQGNGTSTVTSRTAYLHVNSAHDLAFKWLGASLPFLGSSVEVQVNGLSSCNALWSGFAIKLSRTAGECRNTGAIRDVVAHEWGHALDDFDATGLSDRGLSEGLADVLGMMLDGNSCVAESVTVDPEIWKPSDRCTGFRDLDEKAPGQVHVPPVLTVADNDCRDGVHCLGEIFGQASWHLVHNLASGRSYHDAASVGRPLGEDLAYEALERLFMLSRPLAEVMDPAAAGLSVYDAYLIVDRRPSGNHPLAEYINEAFAHHGLAEAPPVDGFDCVAPPAPSLILAGEVDPLGSPTALLEWSDVAGAVRYRVLGRRAGDVRGYLAIGPAIVDDDRPAYFAAERDLELGVRYEYLVLAENAEGCPSADSGRGALTLTFADLAVGSHVELDPTPGGDGDGVLEPGEFFELHLEIRERAGLAGALAVRASIISLDPEVHVTGGPPITFGDIAPFGAAPAAEPFRLLIDDDHRCQGEVPLLLLVDHEGGCQVTALRVALPAAACPEADLADVRFVSARVADDAGRDACSDRDLLLDAGEEGRVVVTVENLGAGSASAVEVLLTTAESELTFLSGGFATLAGPLASGERAELGFSVLVGDLGCEARIPFDVRVDAPESLLPNLAAFDLTVEQDLVPATLLWDFEGGADGWSGDGLWALSIDRSYPDDSGRSFHSGAGLNLCSALRSPPFRLHHTLPASLVLATWYQLEGRFLAEYWDGANVYLMRASGEAVLLTPVSGRGYDAALNGSVLCQPGRPAWADEYRGRSWATSTFDLSPYAGETVALEVRYATDSKDTREGFYVDAVTVSNAAVNTCDGLTCDPVPSCTTPEMTLDVEAPACTGSPLAMVSHFDFFGVGEFAFEWSFGDGGTALAEVPDAPVEHVYIRSGVYTVRFTAHSIASPLCSSSATATVVVARSPRVDAGPDRDGPAAIGTPGFATIAYRWDPEVGLADATAALTLATPPSTTEYCLTATESASGCAAEDCTVVFVPSPCGLETADMHDLRLYRDRLDVRASWSPLLGAAAHDLLRIGDESRLSSAEAWNTKAERVERSLDGVALDPGAVAPPPRLWFYQVVPVCP